MDETFQPRGIFDLTRSVDPDLDKEAIRLIQIMPKWNPGKSKGEVVRSKYTLPITFRM